MAELAVAPVAAPLHPGAHLPGGADGAGQSPSGRYAKLLPAILLYLSYFLLLSAARSAIDSGRLPHWPGMFLVPLVYLLLIGLPLNLQAPAGGTGSKAIVQEKVSMMLQPGSLC